MFERGAAERVPCGAAAVSEAILVNYHGAADTLGALASLPWPLLQAVHVVDNSCCAREVEQLRAGMQAWPRARLHIAEENLGFGRANNLAWQHTRADHVLLLNPDARLREGALAALLEAMAGDARLGAVAPRMDWTEEGHLVLPNLSSQSPFARVADAAASRWAAWAPRAFAQRGARHARRTMRMMSSATAMEAPALSGAALLLRRQAVQAAGGLFDPAYFMFFEDTDLSQRLRHAGWRLAVLPRARAWHAWHNRPEKAALMQQSEAVYLRRYHTRSDWLRRHFVPRLACDAWRADSTPVPRCNSAEQVRQALGAWWAITPLPTLHPAGVRADGRSRVLSDEEWTLLDNGRWYAWIDTSGPTRWLRFDVARG